LVSQLIDFIKSVLHINPGMLVDSVGPTLAYVSIFAIIFSESGLLIGLFFPGDSLLFTAGFLASQGILSLPILIAICVAAAISGDAVGFAFGKRVGRRLYDRPDSRFFKRKHLQTAQAFYEVHGGKTIIIARFVPIVRTMAPIVAGAANMDYRRFVVFNATGGIIWGAGMPIAGFILGSLIPDVDKYLLPIVGLVILLSLAPSAVHFLLERRRERRLHEQTMSASRMQPVVGSGDEGTLREDRAES
jgi:membrane-associated protein